MNTDSKVYLKKKFKQFYWKNQIKAPQEVEKREFGTGVLDSKIRVRHKSFKTERELRGFLEREAPYYISYSSAFYQFPENQPMERKQWLGAEVVFDLDKEIEYLNEKAFEEVREEALNLVDFLLKDFGLQKKYIETNFSGGKGYHIHVSSAEVKELGRDERQEIVDYITATGFDLSCFFSREAVSGVNLKGRGGFHSRDSSTAVVRGPMEGDIGWAKRIFDVALDLVSSDKVKLRKEYGLRTKQAEILYRNRELNQRLLREGKWDALKGLTKHMREKIMERYAVSMVEDTDRMVTVDTSRLIRLPDTLHGGSSLIAKKVKTLESFNPLLDAVAFSDEEVNVKVKEKTPEFLLNGNRFKLNKGETKIPEYVAVYLLLKDKAEIA
ncbi:MAG: DNA primase catalytic subunit PriS [Candidatus Altiarchaeota archaeon]|nr:DNA primase catalytic subunit PriS [Candidatus Altiarchaeota archaeon]